MPVPGLALRRQGVSCGRRSCGKCTHWLYVTDFKVRRWSDKEKTVPQVLQSTCDYCERRRSESRKESKRTTTNRLRAERREERRLKKELQDFKKTREYKIISCMSREQRIEYELEGVLPILPRGVVMEDLDPTPVPTGCPECWRRCPGSMACDECPDPQTKEKRRIYLREVKQQGLALPV